MIKRLDPCCIHWADACANGPTDQLTIDECLNLEPIEMQDFGLLLGKNRSGTAWILVGNVSEEGECRKVTLIPCVNVIGIDKLQSKRKKK